MDVPGVPEALPEAPPVWHNGRYYGPLQTALPPLTDGPTPGNYLADTRTARPGDGDRQDNLLDGLIGGSPGGPSGGGWTNPSTGAGIFGRDKVVSGTFSTPYRLFDQELSDLLDGNDLARRIVLTRPREMFRRGYILVVKPDNAGAEGAADPDAQAEATAQTDKHGLGQTGVLGGNESGPAAPGAPVIDPTGTQAQNLIEMGTAATPPAKGPAPAAPGAGKSPVEADQTSSTFTTTEDPTGERLNKGPIAGRLENGQAGASAAEAGGGPVPGVRPGQDPKGIAPTNGPGMPGGKAAPAGDQGAQAELVVEAESYADRLALKARVKEGLIFGGLYGGGVLIINADDGLDMSEPLDEANIKTIKSLTFMDRRFVFASTWYAEIGPKWGEVETWSIINPFGGQANVRVHETRVIKFDGAITNFLKRRQLLGWSLSLLQAPYDVMRQFDMSFQSVSALMADISQAVMKINGLSQLISRDQKSLQTRMKMVDMGRSSSRMLYIDAENEAFERTATPLTGVSDVLEMLMLRLAAAAEMPVAILFGREPSGLNATGDADFRRFYDVIAGEQVEVVDPKLRRLYTLIFAAKDGPTKGVVPAKGLEFIWHKLYAPSEVEQSTIRYNMAQADDLYINNNTLLPEEVAMSRFGRTGDLHLDTEVNTQLRQEKLATAQLAPSGAEKAQQDQEQKLVQIAATGAAKQGPPGSPKDSKLGSPGGSGGKPSP